MNLFRRVSIIALTILPLGVFAADPKPSTEKVYNLIELFDDKVNTMFANLQPIALKLLFALALIMLIWKSINLLLKGADLPDIVIELVTYIFIIGFWKWAIDNAADLSGRIVDGFIKAAGIATGNDLTMSPIEILNRGLIVGANIIDSAGFLEKIFFALGALIVIFMFAYIAYVVLLAIIEMYLAVGGGVIVLGFAATPWTSDIAKKYFFFVISLALKMYFTFIVVGLCISLTDDMTSKENYTVSTNVLTVLGIVFVFMKLVEQVPNLAQGMMNGVSSGGGGMNRVGGRAAAAAGATGMAVMGGVAAAYQAHKAGKSSIGGMATNATLNAASQATTGLSGEAQNVSNFSKSQSPQGGLSQGQSSNNEPTNSQSPQGGLSQGQSSNNEPTNSQSPQGGLSQGQSSNNEPTSSQSPQGGLSQGQSSNNEPTSSQSQQGNLQNGSQMLSGGTIGGGAVVQREGSYQAKRSRMQKALSYMKGAGSSIMKAAAEHQKEVIQNPHLRKRNFSMSAKIKAARIKNEMENEE